MSYPSQQLVDFYFNALEKAWEDVGACGSCGWHASLWEHSRETAYENIRDALIDGEDFFELGCRNKDDEDACTHRGVRVRFIELQRVAGDFPEELEVERIREMMRRNTEALSKVDPRGVFRHLADIKIAKYQDKEKG